MKQVRLRVMVAALFVVSSLWGLSATTKRSERLDLAQDASYLRVQVKLGREVMSEGERFGFTRDRPAPEAVLRGVVCHASGVSYGDVGNVLVVSDPGRVRAAEIVAEGKARREVAEYVEAAFALAAPHEPKRIAGAAGISATEIDNYLELRKEAPQPKAFNTYPVYVKWESSSWAVIWWVDLERVREHRDRFAKAPGWAKLWGTGYPNPILADQDWCNED